MRRQLFTLGQLHQHLLPREAPQRQGWRIAVHHAAGVWPGSDYYDFLPVPDGRLLFVIADASDQGAASAALAIMVRMLLHSCPLSSGVERVPFCPFSLPAPQPPHIVLEHLNRVLAENKLEEQFMTAFCGVLDPADGSCLYANAGHPYPRWWRAAHRRVEAVRGVAGPPLGTDRQTSYQPQAIQLEPGDLLVLSSDGLTATLNEGGQMFGSGRLDDALREAAPEGAEAVKLAVLAELEDFRTGHDNRDEITLVVLERQQEAASPAEEWQHCLASCRPCASRLARRGRFPAGASL
jgi:phosphoserine phosphatase RsbU/P